MECCHVVGIELRVPYSKTIWKISYIKKPSAGGIDGQLKRLLEFSVLKELIAVETEICLTQLGWGRGVQVYCNHWKLDGTTKNNYGQLS